MARISPIRIPVCNAEGLIIDRADRPRARRLALAPNATVVRKRATGKLRRRGQRGEIVRIILGDLGDDVLLEGMHGDPRKYTYLDRSEDMPQGAHTLRHLPKTTAGMYRQSVTDCLKIAA